MAPKNYGKKLVLNKEIIASLETEDMLAFKGGMHDSPSPKCALTAWDGCPDDLKRM